MAGVVVNIGNIQVDKPILQTAVHVPNRMGIDGDTPYIGDNDNWWIGLVDTGVKAKGYMRYSNFFINDDGYLIMEYDNG